MEGKIFKNIVLSDFLKKTYNLLIVTDMYSALSKRYRKGNKWNRTKEKYK